MGIGKVLKGGLNGGLFGAAKAGGVGLGDIARNGGLGLVGMLAAKKRRDEVRRPMDEDGSFGRAGPGSDTRMVSKKKGGKVKKMAAGGSASKRADGCATKGKTKGKFI
jgi:hypothetical protein